MPTYRLVALALIAFVFAASAFAVTIDTVTVGNPGNAADTRYLTTGIGAVGYNYQIGKYEVTAGQYTDFLNAVADDDPNGLYIDYMGHPTGSPSWGINIQRTGSSPNYSYSVDSDWADRPVSYVNIWDAARFANWLHNGQPTGAQGPGTTEGGAYHDIGNQALFGRSAGARFFIPTEDEWYKAAYHDKTAGLAASYFNYPTGSNVIHPGNDITETTNPGNNANGQHIINGNWAIGYPYFRTVGGEFELSDSPYGTFDQAGNLWEWNETAVTSSSRGIRGGAFISAGYMHASQREYVDPSGKNLSIGFRIASIPEPTADYNGNGLVDAGDYVLWRNTVSQSASPPGSGADGNANGIIDAGDYDFWKARFGSVVSRASGSGGVGIASIPEPSTLLLLGLGVLLIRRRMRA